MNSSNDRISLFKLFKFYFWNRCTAFGIVLGLCTVPYFALFFSDVTLHWTTYVFPPVFYYVGLRVSLKSMIWGVVFGLCTLPYFVSIFSGVASLISWVDFLGLVFYVSCLLAYTVLDRHRLEQLVRNENLTVE